MSNIEGTMTLQEAGEVIRNTMKAKGLTQKDVEEGSGVDQSSVSKILRGVRGPGLESYNKVCKFLEIVVTLRIPTISPDDTNNEIIP